jgi:hypothetical protein
MKLDSRLKYRRTVLLLPLSSSLDAHPYSLSNPSLYKANSPTIPAATPVPRPTCIFPAAPVFSGGAPPDALGVIGLDPLGVIAGVVTLPVGVALAVLLEGTFSFKKLSTLLAASS